MVKEVEYIIDDTQKDYTKYINMPAEERRTKIALLESEAKKERDRLRCERELKAV